MNGIKALFVPPEEPMNYRSFFSMKKAKESPDLQMNPADAIAQSAARQKITSFLTLGSFIAVFLVLLAGTYEGIRRTPQQSVGASFIYNKSIEGVISAVDPKTNTLTLSYTLSADNSIRASNTGLWTIALPPGESLQETSKQKSHICHTVPSLSGPFEPSVQIACRHAISVGRKALIEYAILDTDNKRIIAKTIFIPR